MLSWPSLLASIRSPPILPRRRRRLRSVWPLPAISSTAAGKSPPRNMRERVTVSTPFSPPLNRPLATPNRRAGCWPECRAWLEALPVDSKLLLVQPAAADLDLATLRAKLQAMREELVKLQSTPIPGDDISEKVRAYVSDLMRQGTPAVHGF